MRAMTMALACAAASTAITGPREAHAQATAYPTRPIRLIVPFAPGGGTDVTARLVGARLAQRLGQPVVVDNRPAAAGVVGADLVAKAVPDGHTVLTASVTFVISAALQKGLPFDAFRDFAPITLLIAAPMGVLVHPSVPAKNIAELVAHAKGQPGRVNYGSSGAGSIAHLSTEVLASMAGIRMTHVPYKGVAAFTSAALANEIQVGLGNLFSTESFWKSGRLRLVAHTGSRRLDTLPDVPTVAESGIPGYEATIWYGFLAPAKTPQPIVQRLYREIRAIAETPDVRQTLLAQGNEVVANTPEAFAKFMRAEAAKWGDAGRRLGVAIE
ncbi:MAG: tripartite tricarboxylate transporter substrate binding protein [bacterium]|jgi:tripartite-type tricarboxylate transporter receptor subunit TctC|nr:tripartite tricarboxylate transporter substrate binding protein [Betaproteobacteria bacterium]